MCIAKYPHRQPINIGAEFLLFGFGACPNTIFIICSSYHCAESGAAALAEFYYKCVLFSLLFLWCLLWVWVCVCVFFAIISPQLIVNVIQ